MLVEALPQLRVAMLAIDRFYKGPPVDSWDAPEAIDYTLFDHVLNALHAGRDVEAPIYDYKTHSRVGYETLSADFEVLIVEGLFTLHEPAHRALYDLSVFVDCPAEERLARRKKRDVAERGRDLDDVLHKYETSVSPMHARYVEPQRTLADIVVDGQQLREAVNSILAALRQKAPGN